MAEALQYAGLTLNLASESGAQAEGFLQYAGPLWEELTGIRVRVVELGLPADMERRLVEEHLAATGSLDCASVAPAWLPHLVDLGALEPLDERVERWMDLADLEDYLPRYRDLGLLGGRRYGLFDDGDALLLYYRTDLFDDAHVRASFATRHGRALGDPESWTWDEFVDAARFFTAPEDARYGLAPMTQELLWGWFQAMYRLRGGALFDPDTMEARVASPAGLATVRDLVALGRWMPPGGIDLTDPLSVVSTWLSGRVAMATFWPPLARWAEGYGRRVVGGTPRSLVAGRTGYALLPGGTSHVSVGFVLSVMARSQHKDAAYLFAQWATSPEVSLQRVMLPYALRDPYRRSHVTSPVFRSLWPGATDYLDRLNLASERASVDLAIPGAGAYEAEFRIALTEIRLGRPVDDAVRGMAAAWDAITRRLGRARQRRAYREWLRGSEPSALG